MQLLFKRISEILFTSCPCQIKGTCFPYTQGALHIIIVNDSLHLDGYWISAKNNGVRESNGIAVYGYVV